MDAIAIRNIKWDKKLLLGKINLTLSGYSRAAYRTGFYINELDVMLDAGNQSHQSPSHIFVTHGHGDHIAELPMTLIGCDPETMKEKVVIYCRPVCQGMIANFIRGFFDLNFLDHKSFVPNYRFHAIEPDNTHDFTFNSWNYRVQVIECDHTVPTQSYIFSAVRKKLKEEYLSFPGKEIAELKKNGVEIYYEKVIPQFAFVCDCGIATVEFYQDALMRCEYMIVECTFLKPDEIEHANSKKHIHWEQLKPFVIGFPEVTFILMHFSLKYKDEEIREFFEKENLPNVIPWVN